MAGTVRIIGGSWRTRRLKVAPGVRPCQDVQRERLFNILGGKLAGASCLDLFAGTGSLGLEALSRGAASVTFVERSHRVAGTLRDNIASLDAAGGARIHRGDVFKWLAAGNAKGYDIVFIDPPYATSAKPGVWPQLFKDIEPAASGTCAFCESPTPFAAPCGWRIERSGKSGSACWSILAPDGD